MPLGAQSCGSSRDRGDVCLGGVSAAVLPVAAGLLWRPIRCGIIGIEPA